MTYEELEKESQKKTNAAQHQRSPAHHTLPRQSSLLDSMFVEPDIQIRVGIDGKAMYMVVTEDGRVVPVEDFYGM